MKAISYAFSSLLKDSLDVHVNSTVRSGVFSNFHFIDKETEAQRC